MEQETPTRRPGTFKPGHDPRRGSPHRPKGSLNRITHDLRHGITSAAAEVGEDGAGKGGLKGYLKMCARKHPRQYMALLSRVLPLQVRSEIEVGGTVAINLVSVPHDRFLNSDEMARLATNNLQIEHTPLEPFAPVALDIEPAPADAQIELEPELEPELKPEPAAPIVEPVHESESERLCRKQLEAEARGEAWVMRDPRKPRPNPAA
jgi:hypothetical protein